MGAAFEEVKGAAKHSRFDPAGAERALFSNAEKRALPTFAVNADKAVRTVDQALAIAKKQGVEVPSYVKFVVDESVPADRFADYTLVKQGTDRSAKVTWNAVAPQGVVVVRLSPRVMQSDEMISAVLEHESYELSEIKRTMTERGSVPPAELERMVNDKVSNNLHSQAWDIADLRVRRMRASNEAERSRIDELIAKKREQFGTMNSGAGP